MDENKEILTSENEAENTNTDTTAETTENTTFVADEPTESEEMSFAETEPVNENGVTAPQPKKKSIIQLPIIIGIVIVAVRPNQYQTCLFREIRPDCPRQADSLCLFW